jgi:hypothetical protein
MFGWLESRLLEVHQSSKKMNAAVTIQSKLSRVCNNIIPRLLSSPPKIAAVTIQSKLSRVCNNIIPRLLSSPPKIGRQRILSP